MKAVTSLFSTIQNSTPNQASQVGVDTVVFGRVLDIILDETHPEYQLRGGLLAINGVFYDPIESTYQESQLDKVFFAYQSDRYFQKIPKVGELVGITLQPGSEIGISSPTTRPYYTGVINLWNHPKDNLLLDIRKPGDINESLQAQFNESDISNPIKSSQGDIHLLGRQGQSIRMTGANSPNNSLVDNTNIDKPLILIRTGGRATDTPFQLVSEDINQDITSIYLTTDHIVPLKTIFPLEKTFKQTPVVASDKYKGEQILANTGRIVFNAKEDSVLVTAKESFVIGANTVNIQAQDYIAFEGKEIFLGQKALKAIRPEPVLLGNSTEELLQGMLNVLQSLARDLVKALTVDGKPIPALQQRGSQMIPLLSQLEQQLTSIKSKKVFVE